MLLAANDLRHLRGRRSESMDAMLTPYLLCSWASGLKSCGYATDQKYAQKLITKIEKYELNKFDAWENPYKLILGQ